MKLPLVDLAYQNKEIAAEVRQKLDELVERGDFILGDSVSDFEASYAAFCQVDHCLGVANGTDALELCLRALDVGPGDEVILPANTFIATALGVARTGARPVLVDSEPNHHLVDVDAMARAIGPHTKALVAVDLFGQPADWNTLEALASASGLALVEDAAQAQGARRHQRRAGGFGDAAATSFYPSKNLGAWGDAGAVTTRSEELAARLKGLRNYGSQEKYTHRELGFNSRLDSIQALVLSAKLRHLEAWNQLRCEAAARYSELLGRLPGVRVPTLASGSESVWHIYAICVARRDDVLSQLRREGIEAMVHYPTPIHLQPAFRTLGHGLGDFPNAERAAAEMISLPLFPGITVSQQQDVARVLKRALDSAGG